MDEQEKHKLQYFIDKKWIAFRQNYFKDSELKVYDIEEIVSKDWSEYLAKNGFSFSHNDSLIHVKNPDSGSWWSEGLLQKSPIFIYFSGDLAIKILTLGSMP